MKKSNKVIATIMAVTVAMNAMAVPAIAEDRFVPTEDGVYTTTEVMVYQVGQNNSYTDNLSMCNGAFAAGVDLVVNGEWTDLTLYVCNPSMTTGGFEDGSLANLYLIYDGQQYDGDMISVGYTDPNAAKKLYTQTSNAMFGVEAGNYYLSDTIELTIPTAALAERLLISAQITGMNYYRQSFMLDMTYVAVPDSNETSRAMEVIAVIPANVSTYEVSIPETITLSELSIKEDTTATYDVTVDMDYVKKAIQVETSDAVLTDGSGVEVPLINTFGENGIMKFTETKTVSGSLTVKAEDVFRVATEEEQILSTSITFTITAE